jgi:hypothetical protein
MSMIAKWYCYSFLYYNTLTQAVMPRKAGFLIYLRKWSFARRIDPPDNVVSGCRFPGFPFDYVMNSAAPSPLLLPR